MTDPTFKPMIVAKGVLFAVISLTSAGLIFAEQPSLLIAFLLTTLVWASCRFYYFLFYVLEKHVDPTMRYAGLCNLLLGMRRRRQMRRDA